ncbi:hypothetical protein [Limnoraphis robusta]|uniref:Uncharacterized protein n=1 Tax=Limnoraphis robusta CCNP1315 TaxID=3110306 RepID=A0ABU5U7E8_9CYAN|nr:hypothetical protein [Limnoraphis robusta]MEA5522915.1 hypothetical protein [Limnoraphis robusta CCNP1315]MEA5546823.1 hypothetical protein [Limnoraphis robusta CCNP1324]
MVHKNAITQTDLELLALYWVRIDTDHVAVLGNNGLPLPVRRIKQLTDAAWEKIARACANQGYRQAVLYSDDGRQYPVPAASMVSSDGSRQDREDGGLGGSITPEPVNDLIEVPERELTIEMMEGSELPTYINAIKTTQKHYVNSAAANAQGMPPEQFLAINSCLDLNDPPEFERRIDRVASGETLRNYEYQAWRWYFDPNAARFRVKRMSFVSNFRLIQFNSQPCWWGQVLRASEMQERRF